MTTLNYHPPLLEGLQDQYSVHLDKFDGPLDLLLHLIKKNELDICDISIAVITRQYLEFIKIMKELNLDVAGDFLVMAATLLQIKSRQLLPDEEEQEQVTEEIDSRAELVRRLIEYQQYKEAGMVIGARALLGREVFLREIKELPVSGERKQEGPLEITLFELVDAFRLLLQRIPAESFHHVAPADTFSIADCINEILTRLQETGTVSFEQLLLEERSRERIIVTFLSLLELCRLKMIKIFQSGDSAQIWVVPAVCSGGE